MRPRRRQPTRLPCPWDSPGKNTGVGCHFLLQCMKVKSESEVAQSCPTLSDPKTTAYQAPPSMGFSRWEYWSGLLLPCPQPWPTLSQFGTSLLFHVQFYVLVTSKYILKCFVVVQLLRRRRQWHPTPVLLPGKSHGRRSLVGCSPWGHIREGHDLATKQQQ